MIKRIALALLLLALQSPSFGADAEDARWSRTLSTIASGVVTIQVDLTRAFDTEWNMSSQATGFVVDAQRGLILTNRHVVTPGPVTATAVFQNREEVALSPVYRDPTHDFGLYHYDPSKLKFIKPQQLELYPQGAQIGREIRVVGNDAGEQLSILAGTLARLDREAPNYGLGKYNDFNTFYYQAASSTSGGSSGSPVIDIDGHVLALNAGGSTGAASSFYLPLGRVTRALHLIQSGKPVTRGTLQIVFEYTPYDELRRLGLQPETEADARKAFPSLTGMLVAKEVQPGSAAEGTIQPGDIVVKVDGKLMSSFEPLDELLDASVGKKVTLTIQRGGKQLQQALTVQNLYDISPDKYAEFGDAVVHTLSWQQARHVFTPIRGAYVANPGYVFGGVGVPRGAVITEVNGKDVGALEDLTAIFQTLKQGEHATVRFYTMDDPQTLQIRIVTMDRRWFPARTCHRDDAQGVWPCTDWPEVADDPPQEPANTTFAKTDDPLINKLEPSLVLVNFDLPYSVSGITEHSYYGTGMIVDTQRGLVVTDRNTVPVPMGDVRLTFAGSIEVPGRVVYVHPLHNLAVISYDPKLIGTTPVKAATLKSYEPKPGEEIWAVGLRADSKIQSRSARVASVDPTIFPLSRTLQFRESNLDTIALVNGPGDFDGVLVNKDGDVLAKWASFAYESGRDVQQENRGIPSDVIQEMLPLVRSEKPIYSLEAELVPVPLASARKLGLAQAWVPRIESHSPDHRQVLGVARTVGGTPASELLKSGDLVLAIDGTLANRYWEVERATQKESVELTILRDGEEKKLTVPTAPLQGRDLDRVLIWAGAVLQAPHRAIAAQRGVAPDGVFVAYFSYGSPATRYQLWAGRRILEVDGLPTPNLDAFIQAVSHREDRSSLRLKTGTWNGAIEIITLKLDKRYWPTYELRREPDGWVRKRLE